MDRGSTERVETFRIETAAQLVGIPSTRIRRYVRGGLISATKDERGYLVFGAPDLARLRKIRRLTNDVGLNVVGVEVVLRLLDEIEVFQTGVRQSTHHVTALLETGSPRRKERR